MIGRIFTDFLKKKVKLEFWRAPLAECRNGQYLVGLDLVVADEADDELVPAVTVVLHVEASVHVDAHWGPRGGARAPWRISTMPPMRQDTSIWALQPVVDNMVYSNSRN